MHALLLTTGKHRGRSAPPQQLGSFGGPDAERVAAGERRLFDARRRTVNGQKAQHHERIEQLRHEIKGLSSQRDAKGRELKLVREELGAPHAHV